MESLADHWRGFCAGFLLAQFVSTWLAAPLIALGILAYMALLKVQFKWSPGEWGGWMGQRLPRPLNYLIPAAWFVAQQPLQEAKEDVFAGHVFSGYTQNI